MNWYETADYVEDTYGVFVDWRDRFFICPGCGDPIYECDWEDEDLSICPVCDYDFMKGE